MADALARPQPNLFYCTTEPEQGPGGSRESEAPLFVIQKMQNELRRWHLRVEVGDRLRSWVVPRGVSKDPDDRRIAIPTTPSEEVPDPAGSEAGRVWDTGPYTNLRIGATGAPIPLEDQIRSGHAILWLHGERIQGGYALIRAEAGLDGLWLLVKLHDDEGPAGPG